MSAAARPHSIQRVVQILQARLMQSSYSHIICKFTVTVKETSIHTLQQHISTQRRATLHRQPATYHQHFQLLLRRVGGSDLRPEAACEHSAATHNDQQKRGPCS